MFISRKRFEAELENARNKARVEVWQEQRIDKIDADVDKMAERIKENESKVDFCHDDICAIWRKIDDLQNQLSRMPAD